MRRCAIVLTSLVVLILAVGSVPAAAYVDVGYDTRGDGNPPPVISFDIRSTVRSVMHRADGRFLRVAIRTYEPDFRADSYITFDVRLDARGGRAADAVLQVAMLEMSGSGCHLETRSGRLLKRGRLRVIDGPGRFTYWGVSCRVPVHPLHPTKVIRWKVLLGADVAPNRGMYG